MRLLSCSISECKERTEMATQVKKQKRSYDLRNGGELSFDPQRDLNLPGSYEELLARFQKLQSVRVKEGSN